MNDFRKTKQQLIDEVIALRQRVSELMTVDSKRQQAEQQLVSQRAFFKQIVDINPHFVFVKDREGRFTLVNQAVADAYGTTVDELIGKTDADFNPSVKEVAHFRQDDLEVMDTLTEKVIPEESITDSEGRVRWLQTIKRAVVGEDTRAYHVLGVSTDITERKRVEDALTQARAELEKRVDERTEELVKANQAKSEFLANMSHELRTPLHGIMSYSNFGITRTDKVPPQKIIEYFKKIKESGGILLALLNDLLDLAKLESGRMTFVFKPTDLKKLTDRIVDEFGSLLSERNIKIKYYQFESSIVINLDAERIMQVIRNLLSNAIKYSPQNGVIEITPEIGNDFVKLSIRDHGVGVPENELVAVFDKFIQSSKTKTGAGGTGLGLSICHEIVCAHKGRIWAENSLDRGAIFSFEIPVNLQASSLSCSWIPGESGE